MQKKPVTKEEAMLKMASLCARSEQCEMDIARKLRGYGLTQADAAEVLGSLSEQRFVDNARYARAFARDKVRFAAWGRLKIRAALLAKRIAERTISEALEEIEETDYADAVRRAAAAKARTLDLSQRDDRVKLYRHLLSRGFESAIASAETKKCIRDAAAE